jgi:acetone carboxylase gamma subunit
MISQILGEYLGLDERGYFCRRCEHRLCAANDQWKLHARVRESIVSDEAICAPVMERPDGRVVFRQFYCPGCATQIDTEIGLAGEPFRWNFRPLHAGSE